MPVRTLIALGGCCAVSVIEAATVWNPLPLDRIRVGGSIGGRVALTLDGNLKKIDYEGVFLDQFRTKNGRKNFIGTGNMVEALVLFAKHTGDPETLALKKKVVSELIAAQAADGYIGCMQPEKRVWGAWDAEDVGFILDGLVTDWREFGEKASLDAAVKAADWFIANWKNPPKDYARFVYDKELQMGLAHGIWLLYQETGHERYRTFATKTFDYLDWDLPVVCGRDEGIRGQADGYLDTCYAQLEMFRTLGDRRLLRQFSRFVAHYFDGNGARIDGLTGICECFTGDQDGSGCAGETCFGSYALCTFDTALQVGAIDPARAGDAMERLVHNGFFAAQSKDGRKLRYYTPNLGPRGWWPSDDYCCPCNFRRVVGHLPGYLFYSNDRGIYANLYSAAEAEFTVGGTKVAVRETTEYPSDGGIVFGISPERPFSFVFSLRIPEWCDRPVVKVNGEARSGMSPGRLFAIDRVWKAGDRVEVDFPMDIRLVKGRARQSGRCALMRGPLVYAMDLSRYERKLAGNAEDANSDRTRLEDLFVGYPGRWRVERDDSVRTGGTAIVMEGTLVSWQLGAGYRDCIEEYRFTEFAGEDNTLTYFRIPAPATEPLAVSDRLFRGTGN